MLWKLLLAAIAALLTIWLVSQALHLVSGALTVIGAVTVAVLAVRLYRRRKCH